MKKVLLAGNSFEEKLLFEYADDNNSLPSSKRVSLLSLPGGITFLKEILHSILPGDKITTIENAGGKNVQRVSEARNITKSRSNSIHITRLIGYAVSENVLKNELQDPASFDKADAIVIHDSNGPFETIITRINKPGEEKKPLILYKADMPLARNRLLERITETNGGQLLCIIDADNLREQGMQIKSQLSWEKTLEDFRQEFYTNPLFKDLKKSSTILLRLGLEAVLCIFNPLPGKEDQQQQAQFMFYFIPSMYEGQFAEQTKGNINGTDEIFEAVLLRKILYPDENMLASKEIISISIVAAMKAVINCLAAGYILDTKKSTVDYPVSEILKETGLSVNISDVSEIMNSEHRVSLLGQHTFQSTDLIHYLAFLFVKEGRSSSFDVFPYAEYNKIKTYDRDEIEGFRGLKQRISNYLSEKENKPLSVGVFGPPGSGKSFGVKQIAEFFKKEIEVREFNLSQFHDDDDLIKAFREVGDINLSGKTPLVFFDEFDCDFEGTPLGWLTKFISPMQDGLYKAGEKMHPLGRGIFIFAGGNFATYEQLNALIQNEDYKQRFGNNNPYLRSLSSQQIKSGKLADFISRIKWHLNVKGIDKKDEKDDLYSLRRAMVLRSQLKRYPTIIDLSGRVNIDDDLLSALMEIPEYGHGARSLETIINSCGLDDKRGFHKAYLPSADQLNRDVDTNKFDQLMKKQIFFPTELIEPVAQEIHERWLTIEKTKGPDKITIKPWNELTEDIKDSNRQQAIDIVRKLYEFRYSVTSSNKTTSGIESFGAEEIEKMANMEHDRWMNQKVAKGWVYGKSRNDQLKIHDCLLPWNELDEKTKDLDRNAVSIIPELLRNVGFAIVSAKSN